MEQHTGHKICLISLCKCARKILDIHLVCYDDYGQRTGTVLWLGSR